jgi:hypothetical protein
MFLCENYHGEKVFLCDNYYGKITLCKKNRGGDCGTLNVSFCMTSSIVYYFSFVQDFELMQGAN